MDGCSCGGGVHPRIDGYEGMNGIANGWSIHSEWTGNGNVNYYFSCCNEHFQIEIEIDRKQPSLDTKI